MIEFASWMPAAASAVISSPVLISSTWGRVRTGSRLTPQAAATPRWAGVLSTVVPAVTSLPRGRTNAPALTEPGSGRLIWPLPKVPGTVASMGTIASVPAGSGAPVMISLTAPAGTSSPWAPAVTCPVTSSGAAAVASVSAAAATA